MSFNTKVKSKKPGTAGLHKYKPDFPALVISEAEKAPNGLTVEQIAVKLGVAHSTLYEWKHVSDEFKDAMERANTIRIAKLQAQYDANYLTHDSQGERTTFYDRSNLEHIRMAGQGRNIATIRGVGNELEALQKVQDAVASNEMSFEAAQIMSNILKNKMEVRKTLELQKQLDDMQAMLDKLSGSKK